MSFAVIIPSRTATNLLPCVDAVLRHEPGANIIVVDDGIEWHGGPPKAAGLTVIPGVKPFCFARNVNIGIQEAAGKPITYDVTFHSYDRIVDNPNPDGVVLLNDDALLESPGGFSLLAQAAAEHPEYGIIGAVTNVTGQPLQWRKNVGLRHVPHIAFVCVYIPRRTLELIGLLDERYVTYGWEDNDYTHRVTLAGLKVGVHDGCYVDHGSLRSTFRGDPRQAAEIESGRKIFQAKWGIR